MFFGAPWAPCRGTMFSTPIRRVLIGDDERALADTLVEILSRAGFSARAVYSGESAIETAEFYIPDVLICDVVMEGITGIEAAIRISSKLPDCRILLLSGHATSAN